MIKKKDCLEFIITESRKARNTLDEKYQIKIESEREILLAKNGYLQDIELIQAGINKVNELFEKFTLKMDKDIELNYTGGYSYSFDNTLRLLKENKTKEKIIDRISFQRTKVEDITNERDKKMKLIRDEYDKVWNYCKSLTKSKDIITYLQSLGFDTSSIPDEEAKALVCKVDTSILFGYKNIK